MKSVISEMFDGEKYKTENLARSEEYKKMQKAATDVYENFLNSLDEHQKKAFEEVLDNMFGLEAERSKTGFEEGFKLGLKVAFEALQ